MENKETIEEAAKNYINSGKIPNDYRSFIKGAKWQQERRYSEEDMRTSFGVGMKFMIDNKLSFDEWFNQFKKK